MTLFLHLSLVQHNYFLCMVHSKPLLTKLFQGFGICKVFTCLLMWRVVDEQDDIVFLELGR